MSKRPQFLLMGFLAIGLTFTGCSSPAGQANQPGASSSPPGIQTSGSAAPTPTSTVAPSAAEVFDQVASQVPSAKLVKTYNEDNDPNRLLGRPNGYTSKVAFADSRVPKTAIGGAEKDAIERGGSIEVFAETDLAQGRADYIQGILKNSGFGAEYDYVNGTVLVRVTGNLTPSKAKDYQDALG